MAETNWTPAQKNAIDSEGGSLLVSAAAGSGKTAVLVQRVLRMITDNDNPVDADRLLVATFSNAAAGEMKQRISRKLWELAEQRPGDRRLLRQQLLLDSAQISTIHSFCIRLLRANFHLLGLPADFRVGDERETELLAIETARAVIANRYDKGDPVFLDLVELVSSARSDIKMEQTVLQLYKFLRNHPFYEEWMDNVLAEYRQGYELKQSPWFPIIIDYVRDAANHCCSVLEGCLAGMERDEQLFAAYGGAFTSDLAQLERCRAVFADGVWEDCRKVVSLVEFVKLGRLSGYPDEQRKNRMQEQRKDIKGIVTILRERCFALSDAQYRQDTAELTPIVEQLFSIVTEFDSRLSEKKLQKKLLDYGDLEHYTLRLLYDSNGREHTPSTTALELRGQYHEIMIDEYQDTNGTQEMIFRALTRTEGNQFLVGDVKQSIYRFRQARPENFLEKKNTYAPYDGLHFPAKIALSMNFRTRRETTDLINFIFGMVMSPKIGEMDYADEDALYAGGDYDYSETLPVTLLITDPDLLPQDSDFTEARMVAQEVKRLLDAGTQVQGKTGNRAITPGDICILLRSRTKAALYMEELDRQGVHGWSDRQEGFLGTREIAPVVSYLKILANPLLDLELSQVLCSYLYGFTSDMLARLRLAGGDSMYASVIKLSEKEPACAGFLEDFRLLRGEAVCRPVWGILQLMYSLTGAEHKALAMQQGETRRGNLRLLCEYAADYGNGADLSGFLSYLYSLEEYEKDLPAASSASGNAVSVMSIHKSKGLEFPVVFLCDTATKFNTTDLIADIQLHPELGFACVLRDNRRMVQHRTVQLTAMVLENRRAMLSEELRVVYVALTRAREQLYITASDPKLSHLRRAAQSPLQGGKVSPWAVRSAGCTFDWLASALCRHPDFDRTLLDMPEFGAQQDSASQGRMTVRLAAVPQGESIPQTGGGEPENTTCDPQAVAVLRGRMHWEYPYAADTVTPVKLSVSQLTKGDAHRQFAFTRRPLLLTQKSLTPAERGVAAHRYMQFADYRAAAHNPQAELTRLVSSGFLTAEEGEFIDLDTIRTLFDGPLGKRIANAEKIHREIRFMREFTPDELDKLLPQSGITGSTVIQGVADCVLVENGKGVIIDYKTDMVTDMAVLAERYTGQLRLYQNILEGLLELDITECMLYSFALGSQISV